MTRGNPGDLQPFDPEIDRTFHRLVRHSVHPDHSMHCEHFEHCEYSVVGDSEYSITNFHTENMAQPPPRERTLREMVALDFTYESLCIQYPDEGVPYVLKIGLIHLLPKFHGLASEDPHKHLKEFHIFCSNMKPPDVQEDHIFLKAFPHPLEGVAKD